MHLPGHADTAHGRQIMQGAELLQRRHGGVPPGCRVLLAPQRMGRRDGQRGRRLCQQRAIGGRQDGFHSRRAEIDSEMHHGSIAVQAAFARLDATAAVMKRIPRTPSAIPGTMRLAGSGSRASRRAEICSATSR